MFLPYRKIFILSIPAFYALGLRETAVDGMEMSGLDNDSEKAEDNDKGQEQFDQGV